MYPPVLGWPSAHGVERVPPQGAPGACGGPCFCVVFAFLAWPCTGSPKVPSGYHPQGKLLLLRASFPHLVTVPVPDGIREVDVLGFSAGSFTGLAVHEVLNEFACFPGTTKVAAIASPPDMLRLATGERRVVLLHCLEDRLCVWRPEFLTELSYNIVMIEGHRTWSGRAKHAYGHLLFTDIDEGMGRGMGSPIPCD